MGQTTPLVALLLALTAGAFVLLAHLGQITTDRARARTAADAAALAGAATEGDREQAARTVAAANGSTFEGLVSEGDDVEVTVRVGHARATARARARWVTKVREPAR